MNALNLIKTAALLLAGSLAACTNLTEAELNNTSYSEESLFSENLASEIQSYPIEVLSQEEIDGLRFLREEEKLARDVYMKFYEIFGTRIFNNIAQSEQRHTDAIKNLLDKYQLEDPVSEDIPGIFKNEELQILYDNLLEAGSVSLEEALKVGVAIEEIDILDLEEQLDHIVDNEDIIFVYSNLKRGSENHLRAFTRNLSRRF